MKTLRTPLALVVLLAAVFVRAQDPLVAPATAVAPANARRSPEQLEQLLAPIALYPDALLAIILPAATAPADIVLAARYTRDFPNDQSQVENRAWDESVKSLTHYPEVLRWMDENLDWTKQLGDAFAEQPADVMQAMQRLRAKAQAAGTLVNTPQQQVIAEPDVIRIVPAQPDVIYVPYYQPELVFVDRPTYYPYPYFSFGIGVPVGSWLAFEFDWRRHAIWVGNRHRPWVTQDWRRPLIVPGVARNAYARVSDVRQWRPSPVAPRNVITSARPYYAAVPRPAPIRETIARTPVPHNTFARDSRVVTMPTSSTTAPLAQSFAAAPRSQSPGLRSLPANSVPRLSTTPATAPTVTTVAPAPAATWQPPAGTDRSSDYAQRNRGHRASSAYAAPATPSVNAVPRAAPTQAPAMVVAPQRSYSYSAPVAPATPRTQPVYQPRAPAPEAAAPAPTTAPSTPPARNDNGGGHGGGGRRNERF